MNGCVRCDVRIGENNHLAISFDLATSFDLAISGDLADMTTVNSGGSRPEIRRPPAVGNGNKSVVDMTTSTTASTTPMGGQSSAAPSTGNPPNTDGLVLTQHALHTLGSSVCRALVDRDYGTRKQAAHGIEDIIKFFQDKEIGLAKERTTAIISLLVEEFLNNKHRDATIGGAVGLVGAARGLQENLKYYLNIIIDPIIKTCIQSRDVTVKYYTAECLYNLTLAAPSDVVVFLNELIDVQCALAEDGDSNLLRASEGLKHALIAVIEKNASENQVESLAEKLYGLILLKAEKPKTSTETFRCGFYLALLKLIFKRLEILQEMNKVDSKLLRFRVSHTAACLIKLAPFLHDSSSTLPELEKIVKQCGLIASKSSVTQNNDLNRDFDRELSSILYSSGNSTGAKVDIMEYLTTVFLNTFFTKTDKIGSAELFAATNLTELDASNVLPNPLDRQLLLANAATLVKMVAAIFPKASSNCSTLVTPATDTYSDENPAGSGGVSISNRTGATARFVRSSLKALQHLLQLVIQDAAGPELQQLFNKGLLSSLAKVLTNIFNDIEKGNRNNFSLQNSELTKILAQWISWLSPKYAGEDGMPQDCLEAFIRMLTSQQSNSSTLPLGRVTDNLSELAQSVISTNSPFAPGQILLAVLMGVHNSQSVSVIQSHLSLCASILTNSSASSAAKEKLCRSMMEIIQKSLPVKTVRDFLSKDLVEILIFLLSVWTGGVTSSGLLSLRPNAQSWLVKQLTSSEEPCLPRAAGLEPLQEWYTMQLEILVLTLELPFMTERRKIWGHNLYPRICDELRVTSAVFDVAYTRMKLAKHSAKAAVHGEIRPDNYSTYNEELPECPFDYQTASPEVWDTALLEMSQKIKMLIVPLLRNKLVRYSISDTNGHINEKGNGTQCVGWTSWTCGQPDLVENSLFTSAKGGATKFGVDPSAAPWSFGNNMIGSIFGSDCRNQQPADEVICQPSVTAASPPRRSPFIGSAQLPLDTAVVNPTEAARKPSEEDQQIPTTDTATASGPSGPSGSNMANIADRSVDETTPSSKGGE